MTWLVVGLAAPSILVLACAVVRGLCEGWRDRREYRFDRERDELREALRK